MAFLDEVGLDHFIDLIKSRTIPVSKGGTGVTTEKDIALKAYPVGVLYLSFSATSPAELFGGTWTQITGRFLRAANDVSTGGSDTHFHSNPSTGSAGAHTHWWGATTGGGGSHNHGLGSAWAKIEFYGGSIYHERMSTGTWTANHGDGGLGGDVWENWGITQATRLGGTSDSVGNHTHWVEGNTNEKGAHTHTQGNTGSASSMPAYQDVYVWRRTA